MNSKNNTVQNSIAGIIVAIILTTLSTSAAFAGEKNPHNPYTFLGMQIRTHLLPTTPGANGESLGPLVFQEIVPCRFVSTLEADKYDAPWGGKEFGQHESRTYFPKGYLVSSKGWENPCSLHVPSDAVAVAVRLMAHTPDNAGTVYLAPSTYNAAGQAALEFKAKTDEMEEASVVLRNDGFAISTDQAAHLTIDITGYYLRDDVNAYGGRGEKGDKGDQGSQGSQGIQGDRGEKGEQGLQGERGEKGEQGLQGERGDKGEQGLQGDRGDRGEQGLQGLKGDKGDQGSNGLQGPMGPQGPTGPRGPAGPVGLSTSTGASSFPPPGSIKIWDGAVNANSFIMVQYDEISNGNAIGVASQGNGWFVATGSPNKPFKYIVLTPQ
jgi:hypothetical protein